MGKNAQQSKKGKLLKGPQKSYLIADVFANGGEGTMDQKIMNTIERLANSGIEIQTVFMRPKSILDPTLTPAILGYQMYAPKQGDSNGK